MRKFVQFELERESLKEHSFEKNLKKFLIFLTGIS